MSTSMTFWFYRAYGLSFQTNRPLNQLGSLPDRPTCVDLCVWFTNTDHLADIDWQLSPRFQDQSSQDEDLPTDAFRWTILESPDGEFTRFTFVDGVFFTVNQSGSQVWIYQPSQTSFEYVVSSLMNSILGFCLRIKGHVCLHASGVMIDGCAVLFLGWSGAGKSTTAGTFALRGHTVIADDVSVLDQNDGIFYVQPGYPHVRLWESSAEALLGDASLLPHIAPDWKKQYLDLQNDRFYFAESPVPLGAIYLLKRGEDTISIDPMSPFKALWLLMNHTYLHYLFYKTAYARDFALLTTLVEHIPVRSITTAPGLDTLPDLYDNIIRDFRQRLG